MTWTSKSLEETTRIPRRLNKLNVNSPDVCYYNERRQLRALAAIVDIFIGVVEVLYVYTLMGKRCQNMIIFLSMRLPPRPVISSSMRV